MGLFTKLSLVSRKRKLELFYRTMAPSESKKVLDVGAEINPTSDRGLQLIDSYQWKNNISAVNLSSAHIDRIKHFYPQIDARVGDACKLPWPDKYFDIVYCNAVIEHLGNFINQKKMAKEIMRVGKSWFVATPNRWYPFEFHLRLPFITWFPGNFYLLAGRFCSYCHVKKKYVFGLSRNDLRLMTSKELKQSFLDSKILKQRITFMAETLIVFGGENLFKENMAETNPLNLLSEFN
ncbi:MAG: class I SAM-dependent methyltransferase [Phycisphaerales bacterium]